MRPSSPTIRALAALLVPMLLAAAAWFALPLLAGAASEGDLQSQIGDKRDREQSLSADAAGFARIADRLEAQIALLEQRRAAVQAELDRRVALLERTRAQRDRERAHVVRLRRRLIASRTVLAGRLRELYEIGPPDIVTVVFSSRGFSELLENAEFIERVNDQDHAVIRHVEETRVAARVAAERLARVAVRRTRAAAAVRSQRDALASMQSAVAERRASAERARQARLDALNATRRDRKHLQRELDDLQHEQEASVSDHAGPQSSGGPWAIPWAVVQCESGGQNLPPNWAGASGYYQIIPATWKGFGGPGPAAYLAPKSVQDQVAARIWNGGDGARNWDCWKILNGMPLG